MFIKTRQSSRILILAILAISLALFAVACGGGDEPEVTLATGTPEPAETAPTPEPAQDTENAQEHLEAAAAYYAGGEYDKAIVELEKAIELEPDNADAYTNLALSYFMNGDYENAIATWTEVINAEPNRADAYYERAMSYFNLKQYERAIADLSQAIDLDPTNADAYRIRGKSYAFMEDYAQAIGDFTRAIELDPTSDEAYFNRAVSLTKIGTSESDLANIIADYGMVIQISDDPDLLQQAQGTLETFLENSDDPVLRQQAADALQGKVATSGAPSTGTGPSLMDIDIDRDPGHSFGVEESIEPGGTHRFLFLGSPGDTVGAAVSSSSDLVIGIQNTDTGEILGAVPSNDNSLFVNIPKNELYHVVIEDAGGQGGDYVAAFEASPKVSFALNPNYFIVSRLPEGGLLYYTYTGPPGATLQGNAIPHPDTPVDLVVRILDLESKATLYESNGSGPGENEQFAFTIPDTRDGKDFTFIVTIADVDRNKGTYILSVASDAAKIGASLSASPESVLQAVFDAAKSGDFFPLKELCDPLGENDGDTQMICDTATDEANREEFVQFFATGRISSDAQISPQGDRAEVGFVFGPDGDQEETMELINRDGRWYLLSF